MSLQKVDLMAFRIGIQYLQSITHNTDQRRKRVVDDDEKERGIG